MPKTAHRKTAWELGTGGCKGTLSALSLAKVWALTTLNEKRGLGLSLMDIANEVWVIGRPRRHPSRTAIEKWQAVFAKDPD